MKIRLLIVVAGLLVLVAVVLVVFFLTESAGPVTAHTGTPRTTEEPVTLVDQRPLQTARKLAALASTHDEQQIARDTLRIADQEVDLAFADALHEAREHPAPPTPEMRSLYQHLSQSQATVKTDHDRVSALTTSLAAASERDKESVQQQLELAQAQLTMDQDELDDAREDLTRAGVDPESKIQRLLAEHEASEHAGNTIPLAVSNPAPEINLAAGNLAAQYRAWNALRDKQKQLAQARQDALTAAAVLTSKHQALEQHVKEEESNKQTIAQQAAGVISPQNRAPLSKATTAATLSSMHHFSEDQKAMSDLDKRIQDEQELAGAYGTWLSSVQSHRRMALHESMRSTLWILLIVLFVYLFGRFVDRYFLELTPEKKRLRSVRVVVRFAVQAVGVLLILFVIFGIPSQTPTILGLAGAGLTVALKDFIVAFFGWFVLMGHDGIRVGDWVEINGVGGEVVEVGLLRTVLLETGNWTDSGHPTGRKVAFVNSYAVEGHYFNFSTSGQWLWDEIQILVPTDQNPYPIIDNIRKLVLAETQANARLAEQEWQHTTSRYRVQSFSAAPSINLRPSGEGVQIVVRYIVQAHQRYEVRTRLYLAIVDLLQQKHIQAATAKVGGQSPE